MKHLPFDTSEFQWPSVIYRHYDNRVLRFLLPLAVRLRLHRNLSRRARRDQSVWQADRFVRELGTFQKLPSQRQGQVSWSLERGWRAIKTGGSVFQVGVMMLCMMKVPIASHEQAFILVRFYTLYSRRVAPYLLR